jgi:hypothetical protein
MASIPVLIREFTTSRTGRLSFGLSHDRMTAHNRRLSAAAGSP